MKIYKNNYFILSGAMGGGKSAIIKHLRNKNFLCIDEPARQILEEQRSINGNGVPENDPELFCQLMLSRSVHQYKTHIDYEGDVFFDRGIPDLIAYADLFGINKNVYMNAAKIYLYNKNVFMFNGIEEIYTTDDERKMSFNEACKFGDRVSEICKEFGYNLIDVPFLNEEERSEFIIDTMKKLSQERN